VNVVIGLNPIVFGFGKKKKRDMILALKWK